jgi:hypothetical protein
VRTYQLGIPRIPHALIQQCLPWAVPTIVDFPASCCIVGERPVKIGHRFKRALLGRDRGQTRNLTRVAFDDNFAAFISQLVEDSTQARASSVIAIVFNQSLHLPHEPADVTEGYRASRFALRPLFLRTRRRDAPPAGDMSFCFLGLFRVDHPAGEFFNRNAGGAR